MGWMQIGFKPKAMLPMPLEMQMGLAINNENDQRRRLSGRKSGASKSRNQSQTLPFLMQQQQQHRCSKGRIDLNFPTPQLTYLAILIVGQRAEFVPELYAE